jgi:hypothetical protein
MSDMDAPRTPLWWKAWAATGLVSWVAVIVVAWHFIAKGW